MLGNDRMETVSTEVISIRRRNDMEKSTWRTHRYFVDFKSRTHIEMSTSNRCHNFHVDSPFKIDVISTNFSAGISTSNRWRMDEDVSIGRWLRQLKPLLSTIQGWVRGKEQTALSSSWYPQSLSFLRCNFDRFSPGWRVA